MVVLIGRDSQRKGVVGLRQAGHCVTWWNVLDPLVVIWAGPLSVMGVWSSWWIALSLRGPCVLFLRIQIVTVLRIGAQMLLLRLLGGSDSGTQALPLLVGVGFTAAGLIGKVTVVGP